MPSSFPRPRIYVSSRRRIKVPGNGGAEDTWWALYFPESVFLRLSWSAAAAAAAAVEQVATVRGLYGLRCRDAAFGKWNELQDEWCLVVTLTCSPVGKWLSAR